jgi:nucleotide-binding universal stress UspA family protein
LQAYLSEAKAAAGQALELLSRACEEQGVPFAGDTIERNVVHEGILETASAEDCDLIVMGSHGHRGIKSLILGSVAQKVLAHATQPVLIVKV